VPLLPEERTIRKVGGVGKEFLVGDVHYACGPKASSGRKTPLRFGELPGAWRIEISPALPWEEDYFLNVMLTTDKEWKGMPGVALDTRSDPDRISTTVSAPNGRTISVSFARGDRWGGILTIEERGNMLFDGPLPEKVILEKSRI
jgi:hypothetical protein